MHLLQGNFILTAVTMAGKIGDFLVQDLCAA